MLLCSFVVIVVFVIFVVIIVFVVIDFWFWKCHPKIRIWIAKLANWKYNIVWKIFSWFFGSLSISMWLKEWSAGLSSCKRELLLFRFYFWNSIHKIICFVNFSFSYLLLWFYLPNEWKKGIKIEWIVPAAPSYISLIFIQSNSNRKQFNFFHLIYMKLNMNTRLNIFDTSMDCVYR